MQEGDAAAQRGSRQTLVTVLESALRLLHPLMPYISEEIWQKIAPLAGAQGTSIMLQAFPLPNTDKQNASAESEMRWLQDFVLGLRRIRGEMNISPGKALPILLQGGTQADRVLVEKQQGLLTRMARLESSHWIEQDAEAPEAAIALVGDLKILVPIAGLIDKQAELERLDKEIGKIEAALPRIQGKLNNPGFVDKAPEAVIAKERDKLEALQSQLSNLQAQKTKIEAL